MHITIEFLMLIIAAAALLATIIGNIVAIAFFAGQLSATQKSFDETVKALKDDFSNTVKDLKENFNEKIKDLKENIDERMKESNTHTAEHIQRLEQKQDKHNGIYDKTIANEQSSKSAHKRLDEIKEMINECIAKGN